MKDASFTLGLAAALGLAGSAHAATIVKGDATADLGPAFFLDNAAVGGSDVTTNEPNTLLKKEDFGVLNVGPGGTLVSITGVAWASPNFTNTDAETVTISIRYLGADGSGGGGDDVLIGTVTDSLTFNGAGEYVWQFDAPISNTIDGLNNQFRLEISPQNTAGNGSMRFKSQNGVKFSVAGTSTAVPEPGSLALLGVGALFVARRRRDSRS
ncbi:MAG: PEP-CTERM sorting domain-containing protein [Phycisphaeraceae bacterium]